MATLRDGRFIFIHADRRNLMLEHAVTTALTSHAAADDGAIAAASSNEAAFQLIYGGAVHAVALNAAQSLIALVCPFGSAAASSTAATPTRSDGPTSVLRLFSFARGEVGQLLDELVTAEACDLVWIGNRHLALDVRGASDGAGTSLSRPRHAQPAAGATAPSVILVEVSAAPERLRWVRQERMASSPVCAADAVLCDIRVDKQCLRFWDLQKGKVARECVLPNRRCRQGKSRTVLAACSEGPFVFVVNDDWTLHGFHVGRRAVREMKPMLSQFESQSVNAALHSSGGGGGGARVTESADEADAAASVTGAPPPASLSSTRAAVVAHPTARPRLFARAVGDTQVLVALQGSPVVLQCACDVSGRRDDTAEWSVVAKMRLPRRMYTTSEVVGLSTRGCLLRHYESAEEGAPPSSTRARTVAYSVLPLEMRATGKGAAEALPVASATEPKTSAPSAALQQERTASTPLNQAPETESKRQRKKRAAAAAAAAAAAGAAGSGVDAPPSRTATAPAATSGSTGCVESEPAAGAGRGSAQSSLQRAVGRLLVHAGVSSKSNFPTAFARDEACAAPAPEASGTGDAAPPAADAPAADAGGWCMSDAWMTAGGVVVGVVLGVLVMRRYALI
ncbi:hypothetical protein NESM_000272200 [Novymonas esmeraldas]|uniref:Uncharacterized protein n=1 Tax=Novymonas esmeraldas TaxID=1808958 RepID=A0AAW0F614_9TRYP